MIDLTQHVLDETKRRLKPLATLRVGVLITYFTISPNLGRHYRCRRAAIAIHVCLSRSQEPSTRRYPPLARAEGNVHRQTNGSVPSNSDTVTAVLNPSLEHKPGFVDLELVVRAWDHVVIHVLGSASTP